ncbi:MAG: TetR/AcrR family transcriptional regulator [Rhodobacteraceae bacterium]|nr:TetR/AcrR family transcriptional regulator [Paracoccaceae bacterium]
MHVPPSPDQSTREALIGAGLSLLIEGGPDGLTLRRAAARAGVSHAAPAHHFKGLPGLQTAIAARAFALFTRAMLSRRDAAPATPFMRLQAICDGYLDFAAGSSGLFHVMFLCPDLDAADPTLQTESARAYGVLRDGCLPFSGGNPDLVLEALVWSAVHGFAMLRLNRSDTQGGAGPPPPFAEVLARIVPRDA